MKFSFSTDGTWLVVDVNYRGPLQLCQEIVGWHRIAPGQEGWLRGQEKPRSHQSRADGVVVPMIFS